MSVTRANGWTVLDELEIDGADLLASPALTRALARMPRLARDVFLDRVLLGEPWKVIERRYDVARGTRFNAWRTARLALASELGYQSDGIERCDQCGQPVPLPAQRRRFCSDACRKRASRERLAA